MINIELLEQHKKSYSGFFMTVVQKHSLSRFGDVNRLKYETINSYPVYKFFNDDKLVFGISFLVVPTDDDQELLDIIVFDSRHNEESEFTMRLNFNWKTTNGTKINAEIHNAVNDILNVKFQKIEETLTDKIDNLWFNFVSELRKFIKNNFHFFGYLIGAFSAVVFILIKLGII